MFSLLQYYRVRFPSDVRVVFPSASTAARESAPFMESSPPRGGPDPDLWADCVWETSPNRCSYYASTTKYGFLQMSGAWTLVGWVGWKRKNSSYCNKSPASKLMREQNIHEKVVNIDNQKKKKLFFRGWETWAFCPRVPRENSCRVDDRQFIPDVVATRYGSIEFPPDVAAETSSQMWPWRQSNMISWTSTGYASIF